MIAFLRGTLVSKSVDSAVIDVQGVGYQVQLSARSLARLGQVGEPAEVLTHLQVRDDAFVLYGFTTQREKDLFMRLTSVSSVGPKVALSVLSTYDADDAVAAIVGQDTAAIQRVPGVGKKMASRIVLELKEPLGADAADRASAATGQSLSAKRGAAEALLSMGFTSQEVELALKGAPEGASETVLLQYALKRLGD